MSHVTYPDAKQLDLNSDDQSRKLGRNASLAGETGCNRLGFWKYRNQIRQMFAEYIYTYELSTKHHHAPFCVCPTKSDLRGKFDLQVPFFISGEMNYMKNLAREKTSRNFLREIIRLGTHF